MFDEHTANIYWNQIFFWKLSAKRNHVDWTLGIAKWKFHETRCAPNTHPPRQVSCKMDVDAKVNSLFTFCKQIEVINSFLFFQLPLHFDVKLQLFQFVGEFSLHFSFFLRSLCCMSTVVHTTHTTVSSTELRITCDTGKCGKRMLILCLPPPGNVRAKDCMAGFQNKRN